MSKPTIAELEAMLEDKSVEIDIRPNGEVFVRSENDLLRAELEAARKEIANLEAQRNICLAVAKEGQRNDRVLTEIVAELEAARKVADAATAVDVARNAANRVSALPESVVWPLKILWGAESQAGVALDAAVREYRKLMEGENDNR